MEKRMKRYHPVFVIILAALLFTACTPGVTATATFDPASNPFAPQDGDSAMQQNEIHIYSASLSYDPTQSPDVYLFFQYYQVTACDQLRVVVNEPDSKDQIILRAYSIAEKDKPCTTLTKRDPLPASIILGSYPKGHYSVYVNGTLAGTFDS
jgi:hypothetical protein